MLAIDECVHCHRQIMPWQRAAESSDIPLHIGCEYPMKLERDAQRWRKLCRLMNAGRVSLRIARLAGDDQFCNSSQSMTAAIDRELEKP